MSRKSLVVFILSVILFCGSFSNRVDAFNGHINWKGTDGDVSALISGNAWDSIVTKNTFSMPNIKVKISGFNDEAYTLSVDWELKHILETKEEPVYKKNKKGKIKKNREGYPIVIGKEMVTHDLGHKWVPVKIIKDAVIVSEKDVNMNFDKLFEELTGTSTKVNPKDVEAGYSISRDIYGNGAAEIVHETYKKYPHTNAYGMVSYYEVESETYYIDIIKSRITKVITGTHHINTYNYLPVIKEYFNDDKVFFNYEYAKNDNGTWKKKRIRLGQDGSWYTVSNDFAKKLDDLKTALGI